MPTLILTDIARDLPRLNAWIRAREDFERVHLTAIKTERKERLEILKELKVNGSITLKDGAKVELNLNDNLIRLAETSDPTAITKKGKLYVRDNGSGKTQLVVRFGTGAIQVIATEP